MCTALRHGRGGGEQGAGSEGGEREMKVYLHYEEGEPNHTLKIEDAEVDVEQALVVRALEGTAHSSDVRGRHFAQITRQQPHCR